MERVELGDIVLIHGDCLDVMRKMEPGSVDAVVTDPPYGINADVKQNNDARKGGRRGKGGYYKKYPDTNWDISIPKKEVFEEIFRVGVDQIIFGGNYFTEYLPPSRCWIVWDKVVRANWPDGEMAWGSYDRGLKIYSYSRADAYINSIKTKQHPTQKPVSLFAWILESYTNPGATILDPFMGSGTTLVACVQTGRKGIGIEIDRKYFEIAVERVKRAQMQMRLPI